MNEERYSNAPAAGQKDALVVIVAEDVEMIVAALEGMATNVECDGAEGEDLASRLREYAIVAAEAGMAAKDDEAKLSAGQKSGWDCIACHHHFGAGIGYQQTFFDKLGDWVTEGPVCADCLVAANAEGNSNAEVAQATVIQDYGETPPDPSLGKPFRSNKATDAAAEVWLMHERLEQIREELLGEDPENKDAVQAESDGYLSGLLRMTGAMLATLHDDLADWRV